MSATAAAADQFLTSLESAVQTVANCKRDQRQKREARDAAEGTLLKLMRKTHSELEATLEPDADLEGLTPGGRYKVRVIAANSAGESAPSGIVDVTAPSLANVA